VEDSGALQVGYPRNGWRGEWEKDQNVLAQRLESNCNHCKNVFVTDGAMHDQYFHSKIYLTFMAINGPSCQFMRLGVEEADLG